MSQQVLTLTPGGQPLAQSLGFAAAAVMVDNYTSSYVSLPDAGQTLPPWVVGRVVALPPGITRANAKLIPVSPAVPGPPVPLSEAILTWVDLALPPTSGQFLQQVDTTVQTPFAVIAVGGNATVNTTLSIPSDTMVLAIGWTGSPAPAEIKVQGHQSGQLYTDNTAVTGSPPVLVPFLGAQDTSVDLKLVAGSGSLNFWVTALGPGSLIDVLIGGQPINVQTSTPAPWQAPLAAPLAFNPSINAGATQVIIAAVAGKTVYLFDLDYELDTGVNGSFLAWQDTNATAVSQDAGGFASIRPYHFSGAPLPVGLGLQLKNSGAGPTTVRGHVTYSQQ